MFIQLLIEITAIIFTVIGVIQLIRLGKVNRKSSIFRTKEAAKLTENKIKSNKYILKFRWRVLLLDQLSTLQNFVC